MLLLPWQAVYIRPCTASLPPSISPPSLPPSLPPSPSHLCCCCCNVVDVSAGLLAFLLLVLHLHFGLWCCVCCMYFVGVPVANTCVHLDCFSCCYIMHNGLLLSLLLFHTSLSRSHSLHPDLLSHTDTNGLTAMHWSIFYNHSQHLSHLLKR